MRLSNKDAELFYKLWLGLICFVNKKYKIESTLGEVSSPKGLDIQKLMPIRDRLWSDVSVIDEYINHAATSLNDEERTILSGWKNAVNGQMLIFKHLKNHSVFMTQGDNARLYGVIGIYSAFEEMIPKQRLPMPLEITLLPFKGKIIYDSLLKPYNVLLGSGYKSSFNDEYRRLKEKYGIITDLQSENTNDTSEIYNIEEKLNKVRKANEIHLKNFEDWLKNKGLSEKTIYNHVQNVDFYINEFLCYYDALDVKHGCYEISNFLGDWFIRKTMWASCAQIKSNAASIKKFYAFLLEIGIVGQNDYDELISTIKDEMSDWLDKMEQYDKMDDNW